METQNLTDGSGTFSTLFILVFLYLDSIQTFHPAARQVLFLGSGRVSVWLVKLNYSRIGINYYLQE